MVFIHCLSFGYVVVLLSMLLCATMVSSQETIHQRSYFYVGGEYMNTSTDHVLQGQMYVEKLTPYDGCKQPYLIVFIHGNGQTGTNWLNKPEGGKGWVTWFLDHGYEIYIIDQTHTGRSPWYPQSGLQQSVFTAETIQQRFTAFEKYPLWEQAKLHTQWPGTGMMGDPIFNAYFASIVQSQKNSSDQEPSMQKAGAALLDKIGPAVLIAHSQGGLAGWSWTDARPDLVKALVQIEPKGPPCREVIFSTDLTRPWGLTSIPLAYSPDLPAPLSMEVMTAAGSDLVDCVLQQKPARQLANLRNVPILIDTGEASYHAPYDYCTVAFLRQAGCEKVEHLKLGDVGIHGNGHLQFLEKNSDDIAVVLEAWISRAVA